MAENIVPTVPVDLSALGAHIAVGLGALATPLGITQITPAAFQTKLTAFNSAEQAYLAARSTLTARATTFSTAEAALTEWLYKTRAVLVTRLGRRWNGLWVAAGFIDHSTAVPASFNHRKGLANTLVGFFTANPTYEVAAMGVTASAATSLLYTLTAAGLQQSAAKIDAQNKKAARDTTQAALTATIRALIKILGATLAPLDTRWEEFGLNLPGANTTPGQPQELSATVQPANTIVATCAATPLATRYRWRIKVVGVDESFRLATSTPIPIAEIKSVKAGQTVDVYVQAVNGQSQGVASATVRAVLPPVAGISRAAAPAEALAPELAINAAEHGYRNGNGAHATR